MSMTVTDDQTQMARLMADLLALKKGAVTVGFHADGKPRQEGEATNATIAAAHEFGTDTIERRPFLAPALEKGQPEIGDLQAQLIGKVFDGSMSAEQALGVLGEKGVALVRAEITSSPPPALHPDTIAAKGSSRTLVDTGQMLGAVSYELDMLGAGNA